MKLNYKWILDAISGGGRGEINLEFFERFVSEVPELFDVLRMDVPNVVGYFDSESLIEILKRHPRAFGLNVAYAYYYNGHVRHAAVRNLADIGERSLPYLLIRSCDWVDPVAAFASRAAVKLIPDAKDSTLEDCFKVLPVLNRLGYHSYSALPQVLQEMKRRPGFLKHLRTQSAPNIRSEIFKLGLVGSDEITLEVLRAGLIDPAPRVSQWSAQQVASLSLEERQSLLPELMRSPAPLAQIEAFKASESLGSTGPLVEFLDRPHWLIRASARISLEKLGFTEFLQHYRLHLPAPGAIAGFAEVADEEFLTEIIPFLQYHSAEVKIETIRAFRVREVRSVAPQIANCLADPTCSVVRAAVEGLSALGYRIDRTVLERLHDEAPNPRLKATLEGATVLLHRWDAIDFALTLASKNELYRDLNVTVRQWCSRACADIPGPSAAQLDQLKAILPQVRWRISESNLSALDAELLYRTSRLGPKDP